MFQLRPVIQQNRPTPAATPLNISGNSTVMLRTSQVIPIQQTTTGEAKLVQYIIYIHPSHQ